MSECNVNQLSSDAACFTCLDSKIRDGIQTELLCQILTAIGEGGSSCVTQCTEPWIVEGNVNVDNFPSEFGRNWTLDFLTDQVDVSGSTVIATGSLGRTWTLDFATDQVDATGSSVKIYDGTDAAEVNARTDGIVALEVADDMTSFETQRVTLVANIDTTITFSQAGRLVRIKNNSLTATVFVRDGAISSSNPTDSELVGVSPLANLPTTEYYPIKTTTIHLMSSGTPTVDATIFF